MPPFPTAVFLSARVRSADWTDAAESAASAKTSSHASNLEYASVNANPTAQERNAALTDVGASVETALADGHVITKTSVSKMVVSRTAPEKSAARMDVAVSVAVVLPENLVALAHAKGAAPPTVVERNVARTDVAAFAGQDAQEAKFAAIWEPV